MYRNNFLVSIVNKGEQLREFQGSNDSKEVSLPLNSEYEILLRNDNYFRAKAIIKIDGKNICADGSGFVVDAKSSMRIERFVDSLIEGRKFKVVSVDNPNVDDPKSSENGIIRVEWYRQVQPYIPFMFPKIPFVPPYNPWNDDWNNDPFKWVPPRKIFWTCGTDCSENNSIIYGSAQLSNQIRCSANIIPPKEERVATIEGSHSDQKFTEVNYDFENFYCTCMVIKLKGYNIEKTKESFTIHHKNTSMKFCNNCGLKVNKTDKYCSNCGNQLIK